MFSFLNKVQNGTVLPSQLIVAETTRQIFSLELSKLCDVERVHKSGVNSLDIEKIDARYLLSGGSNGSIFIHDLENHEGKPQYSCKLIGKVDRKSVYAHSYSVEKVQWYPYDTGSFTSSGMDSKLKIWDTNSLRPVDTIKVAGKVYCHETSPKTHSLVAVGMASPHVQLIDFRTGSGTHNLMGHKSKVLSVAWCPMGENLLASGGCDNKLLLWDIRSSKGHLYALDRHNTKIQTSTATAHGGAVNGLKFTPDGLHLLSFGTDNKVRLWDVALHRNTLVNYGKIENDNPKCISLDLCTSSSPQVIYVPSEGHILALDLFTGANIDTLMGHFNSVNCCVFRPFSRELYSGGNDRNILIWLPYTEQSTAYQDYIKEGNEKIIKKNIVKRSITEDAWSSDEN